jgi:hypothetical protein
VGDNPKTVTTLILRRRQREIQLRYRVLASYYVFDPEFCISAQGNEKPNAKSNVKAMQRRFATPVPRVANLAELNADFHGRKIINPLTVVPTEKLGLRLSYR